MNCQHHPDQPTPCATCAHQRMLTRMVLTDKDLGVAMRAGLIGIVTQLERGGDPREVEMAIRAELLGMAAAIEKRWNIKPKKVIN